MGCFVEKSVKQNKDYVKEIFGIQSACRINGIYVENVHFLLFISVIFVIIVMYGYIFFKMGKVWCKMQSAGEKNTGKSGMEETDFYADTMERETTVQSFSNINRDKGIFKNKYAEGLNLEKGIFEKTALFITK